MNEKQSAVVCQWAAMQRRRRYSEGKPNNDNVSCHSAHYGPNASPSPPALSHNNKMICVAFASSPVPAYQRTCGSSNTTD